MYTKVGGVTPALCIPGSRYCLQASGRSQRSHTVENSASSKSDVDLDLLSSITSTKIKKIVIAHSTWLELPAGHACWLRLDDISNRLVEGLERGLGLEVEFQKLHAGWVERGSDLEETPSDVCEEGAGCRFLTWTR